MSFFSKLLDNIKKPTSNKTYKTKIRVLAKLLKENISMIATRPLNFEVQGQFKLNLHKSSRDIISPFH